MNIITRISIAGLLIIGIICVLASCTRNNGDIGNFFGTWQIEQICTNEIPDIDYKKNIFWKFQNSVIQMVRVSTDAADHERDWRWGTWSEEEDILLLNFTHSDNANPIESGDSFNGFYTPFPELHFPDRSVIQLCFIENKSKSMVLSYKSKDGNTYTYYLNKQ